MNDTPETGSIWAVLPIKDMSAAKQRLSPVLAPHERRGLFAAMAEDVLSAIAAVDRFDGILVVTGDPDGRALAERYGAEVLSEAEDQGQTSAVTAAATALRARGVGTILALPGDVPTTTADEIRDVLAAHGAAPAMTIVPAGDGRGSNCVVSSPPDLIPFAFGNDSFRPHLAAAHAAGVRPRVIRRPGIRLDIDTPDDLRMLLQRPADTRAHAFLESSGIAARLAGGAVTMKG